MEGRSDKKAILAYIIGVALGDGNLSNPNKRAVRLRITCDRKYPNIIKNIQTSLKKILPNNAVSLVHRKDTCVDVSCYSNKWEGFLGWKVGKGTKLEQNVKVPNWIFHNKNLIKKCLKGLFETDGSVYNDRGYRMVNFVTAIPTLAKDTIRMIKILGFKPNLQIHKSKNKKDKYTIRVSQSSNSFI